MYHLWVFLPRKRGTTAKSALNEGASSATPEERKRVQGMEGEGEERKPEEKEKAKEHTKLCASRRLTFLAGESEICASTETVLNLYED